MASLMPAAKQQFFNAAGQPLSGGKLYTYSAGTVTPRATYSDPAGTVPNTNPIILDARGEAIIYWGGSYKIVLQDALGNSIYTLDNYIQQDNSLAASAGASLVGFQQAGTGAVARTVQDKARESVSVRDFGAVGDGVADDTAAFNAALNASKSIFVPPGTYKVSGVVVPSNATISGAGAASIILCATGNAFSSTVAAADIFTVSRLKFSLSNSARGIYVNRATLGNCTQLNVWDCDFYGSDTTPVAGIYATGVSQGNISRNVFHAQSGYVSAMDGIDFISDTNSFNLNVNIEGNYFYDISNGIYCSTTVDTAFTQNAGFRIINNCMLGLKGYGIYARNVDWFQIEENLLDYVYNPVYVLNGINVKIKHNYFAANQDNVCIYMEANSTAAAFTNAEYTEIIGNRIFNYRIANALGAGNDGIVIKATNKNMNQTAIRDNTIDNVTTAINFNTAGASTSVGGTISGNTIRSCTAGINLGAQTAANIIHNNSIKDVGANYIIGTTGPNIIEQNTLQNNPTQKRGKLVANGTGAQVLFTAPHGMTQTPTWAAATVGGPVGATFAISYDATNVIFTFQTAPAAGTNNVIVNWEARTFI